MIILRAYPRLHIGLLDLGSATPRRYGGAGFLIDGLPIQFEITRSFRTSIHGTEQLDPNAKSQLSRAIERFRSLVPDFDADITLTSKPLQHVGLGTKTALLLGVLKGLDCIANSQLDNITLQRLSGRGGTSGVGLNAFFVGGFVADLGQQADCTTGTHAPSSAAEPRDLPPIGCKLNIPTSWNFHLILPGETRFSGPQEVAFFKAATPLPKPEVFETIATMYHGIVPAVLEGQLLQLRQSLIRLHQIGFKARELSAQSDLVRRSYKALQCIPNCAVGLSSIGPLLYVVADESDSESDCSIMQICESFPSLTYLGRVKGRNEGFEVVHA